MYLFNSNMRPGPTGGPLQCAYMMQYCSYKISKLHIKLIKEIKHDTRNIQT